jgi:hypothetical protein
MRLNIFIGFLALVVFCLVSLPSQATVVMKLSEEDMASQAGTIITGTVTSVKSEWNEERTKIFTYITITPGNFLKGDRPAQEIVIVQPGGEVGDVGMLVDGTPVFEEGEEVLLFLKRGRKGFHRTVGLSQGEFSIQSDPVTQRKVLLKKRPRLIRDSSGKIKRQTITIKSNKKLYLDDFEKKIKDILQRKNGAK